MNDDEPNTYLLDHDPARLLPYSKRLADEDPEATDLGYAYQIANDPIANAKQHYDV